MEKKGGWRATVLMRAFLQLPLYFKRLILPGRHRKTDWNTNRHTHEHAFLLQLVMTDAEAALQPTPQTFGFQAPIQPGTTPVRGEVNVDGEQMWKMWLRTEKEREMCGVFFVCLFFVSEIQKGPCVQAAAADNRWRPKQKQWIVKWTVFNSARHKPVIFGRTVQSF